MRRMKPMRLEDEDRRTRRRHRRADRQGGEQAVHLSATGGQLSLVQPDAQHAIHQAALTLLAETGLADAPAKAIDLVTAAGGWLSASPRRCRPASWWQ